MRKILQGSLLVLVVVAISGCMSFLSLGASKLKISSTSIATIQIVEVGCPDTLFIHDRIKVHLFLQEINGSKHVPAVLNRSHEIYFEHFDGKIEGYDFRDGYLKRFNGKAYRVRGKIDRFLETCSAQQNPRNN
jgi:hypothetical protein